MIKLNQFEFNEMCQVIVYDIQFHQCQKIIQKAYFKT